MIKYVIEAAKVRTIVFFMMKYNIILLINKHSPKLYPNHDHIDNKILMILILMFDKKCFELSSYWTYLME